MPHAELMRWSSFLEIEPNSRLVHHNRLFSNWFRARLKLSQNGQTSVVHRIAAKRVVLEAQHSQPTVRMEHSGRKFSTRVAAVLLMACVASSVFTVGLGSQHAEPKSTLATGTLTNESLPKRCLALTPREPFEVRDLNSFEVEGWTVKTFGSDVSLGALQSISFEAKCQSKLVLGSLVHSKNESGDLILRMTPIKRPGS